VDPEALLSRIESRFGGEQARPAPPRKAVVESFTGRSENARQVFDYMQREQSHLVVGFPGVTIDDSDRFALEVLTTILGGQGGRLFVELRDRQSLAYQIGAFSLEGLDPGYVAVYLSCSPDKTSTAVASVREIVGAIVDRGVTAEELERSKRYLIGTHEISLQRRASLASALAFHKAYGLSYDQHLRYPEYIEKVSRADIKRVAQRIFDWDLAVTATVTPPQASPEAARRMRGVVKKRKRSRKKRRGKERAR
jgi:zinc protease